MVKGEGSLDVPLSGFPVRRFVLTGSNGVSIGY
jgi:hypothetical protein